MSEKVILDTPENWDAASSGYAEKVAPIMMASYVEEFVENLDVNDTHKALEVACGSGALTDILAIRAKSVLATDFSPNMLELAKIKIANKELSNVDFKLMDGQALEVEDNSMDRAACCFGLMLFPDRHKGMSELNRVLKPGGKAMISGWAGVDKFEGFGLFIGAIHLAFPDFPKPDSPPPVFSLADLNDFKSQMEAAGFTNVKTSYVEREMTLNNFDELWGMMTVGAPPVRLLFDKVGEEGKAKVKEALASIVKEKFGNGPIKVTNSATMGIGEAS